MPASRRTVLAAAGTALAATAIRPARSPAGPSAAAEPGGVGHRSAAELTVRQDPVTGATIRQLTDYRAHSNHAYFTYSAWYDGGRKLVIISDRGNRTNLYGVDLETGEMVQLTDWDPAKVEPHRHAFVTNPVRDEVVYIYDGCIEALDLSTLTSRVLMRKPDGYTTTMPHVTADGRFVVTGFNEDLSGRIRMDIINGYVGFAEYWAAKPRSTIWKIPLAGGEPEMVHEERNWLNHFNASPKLPHLMTFCHEGPWHKVDHRMWCLDLATGRHWKIRPTAEREPVGHEYWMADGERIGYHGSNSKGGLFGSIRYDNTEQVEGSFAAHCWHFHSHLLDLVVGDGDVNNPYLLAWRFRDGVFEGPKVIAEHRGSFHTQQVHVHPCVHAAGTKILYTADPQGYGQVNIVEVPDWEALPDRDALPAGR
jgi:oligogalacturonide lyase